MTLFRILVAMVVFGLSRSFAPFSFKRRIAVIHEVASRVAGRGLATRRFNRNSERSKAPATPKASPVLTDNENKRVKRKVALVFSYVGTEYNGLQMDTQQLAQGLVAVEAVIERELHHLKYIKDSNHLDLSKIGWSRSSRTDKGVHCARIVLSAKLEFDPEWLPADNEPPQIKVITEQMNERLPPSIRMISCFRTVQSFRARENSIWREYEYLLPVKSALSYPGHDQYCASATTPLSKSQFIARLNGYLNRFEGEHSLHNFHRTARRDLRPRGREQSTVTGDGPSDQGVALSDDSDALESMQSDEKAVLGTSEGELPALADASVEKQEISVDNKVHPSGSQPTASAVSSVEPERLVTNHFERWYPTPRDMLSKTQGSIFVCEARELAEVDGVEMVRIRVRGQSFLLHQIRIIVGTSLYCALGRIPDEVLNAAFELPYHVPLPMAPAEGLMLVNSGYIVNSKPLSTCYTLIPYERPAGVPVLDAALLTDVEFAASELFKTQHIYPQIVRDWRGDELLHEWFSENDQRYAFPPVASSDSSAVIRKNSMVQRGVDSVALWRGQNELIKIFEEFPTTTAAFWTALRESDPTAAANRELETKRVGKDTFRRQRFLNMLNDLSSTPIGRNITSGSYEDGTKQLPHQELLPTGMYNALTVYARIQPGSEIAAGCMGVASLILRGKIPIEWSPEQIIAHVEPLGGLPYLIDQPLDPRLR